MLALGVIVSAFVPSPTPPVLAPIVRPLAVLPSVQLNLAAVAVGSVHTSVVTGVRAYGAFVRLEGRDGLLHISQLHPGGARVTSVGDILGVGDRVRVRVLGVDGDGKVSLTARGVKQPQDAPVGLRVGSDVEPVAAAASPPTAAEIAKLPCVSFSYSRSSGAGGQNVNKLDTRCTARLDISRCPWPAQVCARLHGSATSTGVVIVSADRQRTQAANRKDAVDKLAARVAEAWRPPKQRHQRSGPSAKGKRARHEAKARVAQKKRDRSAARRGVFESVAVPLPRRLLPSLALALAWSPAAPARAFTGLGLAAKARRRDQEACFERVECAEAVPAYDIQCGREDSECLERRQRLARQEFNAFLADPGGFVGVAALLLVSSTARLFRSLRRGGDER